MTQDLVSQITTCRACKREETNRIIASDECDHWFHYDCFDLKDSDVDRILDYYFWDCTSSNGKITTRKTRKPIASERLDKTRNYYEVDKIVG